jgi:hypothetical protein
MRRQVPDRVPAAALIALVVAAACGPRDAPRADAADGEPAEQVAEPVLVRVDAGSITAPDTIAPGWRLVRVEEDGAGHIPVIFLLQDSASTPDIWSFLRELDEGVDTPGQALALGGPEVGDSGEVFIRFTPGRYLLGCVIRGDDGHRHALTGEARMIVVLDVPPAAGADAPPEASYPVRMIDFAYMGPEDWEAGPQVLRVDNAGQQDHQLRIARLKKGSTMRDWLYAEEPNEHATNIAGVARMGSGVVAYLPVDLTPGEYVIYCLVPDKDSGKPHRMLGMLRAIHVK